MRHDRADALPVGAVPFLNGKPLTAYIDASTPPPIDLILAVPSLLTEMLSEGKIVAALLPSIEYFRTNGYRIVPGISIAADGMVESVRIFSKAPIEDIRVLALDERSRTSVALCKILLKRKLQGKLPAFVGCTPDDTLEGIDADAMLLIGDAAMQFQTNGPLFILDLGEEWKAQTGLPFVYALWVVRSDADVHGLAAKLARAREEGLRNLDRIAEKASRNLSLSLDVCANYLRNIMQYDLGDREIEALGLFQKLAAEDGLCPGDVSIAFEHR